MNIQYIHPADQLVMFMQRIYDKGMTTMSGGNLSIKHRRRKDLMSLRNF